MIAAAEAPVRVILCDDHELIRCAFRATLTADEGIEVVGDAANGAQALDLVARLRPDVVLLDLEMPVLDGMRCLEALRDRHPETKVLVVSSTDDRGVVDAALRRGAVAYVLKSINPLDLAATVRQAVEPTVFRQSREGTASASSGLSRQEAAVLTELVKGCSNREIARALWLSEQTVKFHLRNVYRKLGVANRTDALRLALERDLVAA